MHSPRRSAEELPLARFTGVRWVVAMSDKNWRIFRSGIAEKANERLTAILESFSEEGEVDLPRGCFRWFAPRAGDPNGVELGAFEAHGVVLSGRRAIIDRQNAFFITDIFIDKPSGDPPPRRRRSSDERQTLLPLGND